MSLSRASSLDRLRNGGTWDVLIVGGGATGLGAGVDAASRGYQTVLLEARDFAHGTSSRSTKLIHGGVRYLAQGNIPLVREALRERGLLVRNAPHLVHTLDFVVPAYRFWRLPYYATGLWLYDRLAGDLSLGHSRWISAAAARTRLPTLRAAGLRGGISYTDGQFDDARLAITLARTMEDLGGLPLNYCEVRGFIKENNKVIGALVRDVETGETIRVLSKSVINATGVQVDEVRRLDDPSVSPMVAPSQGAHVVLDREFLPGSTAIMVPKTDDGRVLFAIPWNGRVLVGTTDTPMAVIPAEPVPLQTEIDFLIQHAARYLDRPLSRGDIRSAFAGLRPLIRPTRSSATSTAKLSREHAVLVSTSGLVTITGGKWTTYRLMSRDGVDHAGRVAGLPGRPCSTSELRLHGWCEPTASGDHLEAYGSDQPALHALTKSRPELGERLHPSLPYLVSEVVWAARHEAARTVEDVLARRTRALFLDAQASMQAAPTVASIMAQELGRDDAWRGAQVEAFQALATQYLPR